MAFVSLWIQDVCQKCQPHRTTGWNCLYASDKLLCYHNHRKQDKRDRFAFQAPKRLQVDRKKLSTVPQKPETTADEEYMILYELSQEQIKGETAHCT